MNTYVIINKSIDEKDVEFASEHFDNNEIIGVINYSQLLHKFERGETEALDEFVEQHTSVFQAIVKRRN